MSSKKKSDKGERTVHASVKQRSRELYAERKQRYRAKTRLTETETSIVDQMHPVARKRFLQFSYIDQKRFLKKAERILLEKEKKEKGKAVAKSTISSRKEKSDRAECRAKEAKSEQHMPGNSSVAQDRIVSVVSDMAIIMNALMSESDMDNSQDETSPVESRVSGNAVGEYYSARRHVKIFHKKMDKSNQKNFLKRKRQKEQLPQRKGGAGKAKETKKKAAESLKKLFKKSAEQMTSAPALLTLGIFVCITGAFIGIFAIVVGMMGGAGTGTDSSTYQCQVSEQTESYRELVEKYCEQYGIEDYVDLCLAVMEQESGGNGTDVMQAEQSYYNTNPPIDTAEESIDCGVHELSDCLTKSGSRDSSDIPLISLALQGYNFGNGYIEWAKANYGGYSAENAVLFSQRMCSSLGYSSYGDVDYVPHVLRYYVPNSDTTITNEGAANLIKELKENNQVSSSKVWTVIEKGTSLCGKVTYGMLDPPRQDDGRDAPTVLDCSSFVAWCFHKSGFTGIPYSSTTATFISSTKFVTVPADDLKPGDIGLKSETAPTGGANHVGIYCGKRKDGTKIWMHCTSESGTSLTGNASGVMLGSYSNFTYFRRLKKWN